MCRPLIVPSRHYGTRQDLVQTAIDGKPASQQNGGGSGGEAVGGLVLRRSRASDAVDCCTRDIQRWASDSAGVCRCRMEDER